MQYYHNHPIGFMIKISITAISSLSSSNKGSPWFMIIIIIAFLNHDVHNHHDSRSTMVAIVMKEIAWIMRVTENADSSKCQLCPVPGRKMLIEAAPWWMICFFVYTMIINTNSQQKQRKRDIWCDDWKPHKESTNKNFIWFSIIKWQTKYFFLFYK